MKIARRKPLRANIGILGAGHQKYWRQFAGLHDEMRKKLGLFCKKVEKSGAKIKNFGMVDDAVSAYNVVPRIKAANIDLLFIDMLTYATSSAFGIVAREINVPQVMAILQPMEAMDYARASTFMQLCNDDVCAAPEFAGVSVRMGKKAPETVIGMLDNDPAADKEISDWCRIANVLHDLKTARLGHMGHVLEAMLGIGLKADGKFKMIVAGGESVAGPVPPTGNTNTHGRFRPDVRTFLKRWLAEGPTHHFALGIGHEAEVIKKIGWALDIEAVIVT